MHPLLVRVQSRIMEGCRELVNEQEARELCTLPRSCNLDLFAVASLARARFSAPLFTCAIINAKSGKCPENCAFCAQSAHHHTGAPEYPLVDTETLVRHAAEMKAHGVARFGIVTSGTTVSDRDLDSLCASAETVIRETGIAVCGSLGMMDRERARRLREAGFTSYHHNLETARSNFANICTTHEYDRDLETLAAVKAEGFRVCSCGIFGLGESWDQRVELLLTEREAGVDSLPVNFLSPVKGTRLGDSLPPEPWEALRTIAVARLVNPEKDVIICGGRLSTFGDLNSWVLAAGANGIMTGNYLTTKGCGYDDDDAVFRFLGAREV